MATEGKLINTGDLIAVTGATGFIGSYVVELLLSKGYRVRAVGRDTKNEEKYALLKTFPQKEGQLTFAEGDFGSYDNALSGCDGVIHLASPYLYSAPDPQKEIVEPAIEGVRSMLNASIKTPSIKRVVVTSSGGAILHFPVEPNYVFSSKDWNNVSSLTNMPYFLSKKLAEETGWSIWNENKEKFDLVVVNPLLVLGPPKTSNLNASQLGFRKTLMGETKTQPPGAAGVTDVRDVAQAHLIALENPQAAGQRLISYSCTVTWKAMAAEMKKQFPEYPVSVEPETENPTWSMDTSPLKGMGLTSFKGFPEMIHDTTEALITLGAVPELRKK